MKILNIKIDIPKIIGISITIIILFLMCYLLSQHSTIHMNQHNFTTILRDSHQDFSKYLGRKIVTSGYVFRGKEFANNQFVIARDMLISETEANIVGFLCDYEQANDFENNEWVEATGTIVLGDYYGPIPIIQIESIHRITTPEDIFVSLPK